MKDLEKELIDLAKEFDAKTTKNLVTYLSILDQHSTKLEQEHGKDSYEYNMYLNPVKRAYCNHLGIKQDALNEMIKVYERYK